MKVTRVAEIRRVWWDTKVLLGKQIAKVAKAC